MKLATITALSLTASLLISATAANADSGYQPFYMEDRENLQFANVPPPQVSGTPVPTQSAPSHVAAYQAPRATLLPDSGASSDTWQKETPLFHDNNEVWASAGTSLFKYTEAVTPLPDSERGWLPSISTGATYMTHDNLFLSLDGSATFGNTDYEGALFSSPTTPVEATTKQTIYATDAKVGEGFYLDRNAMLIPYVDGGFRYWDRNLGSGQTEDYHNFEALAGLMIEGTPLDNVFLSGYGSAGTTLGGRMKTGGFSYTLGDSAVYKVGGKIGVGLTRQIELFTTLDYDHFRYSKSPINNSALEPGSQTSDTTMRVGLGYHFR